MRPNIALLCSGLDHIYRGHESFARDLLELLTQDCDVTLLKGSGAESAREKAVPCLSRLSTQLDHIQPTCSPKWDDAFREHERYRIEAESFAYGSLSILLAQQPDIIHCLEKEACQIIYANRHLFGKTPAIVFSNGGALTRRELPDCDLIQEHTPYNLSRSRGEKAVYIPHGIELGLFNPDIAAGQRGPFRAALGIPEEALVVITVGRISRIHKRTHYAISEVAKIAGAHLIIAGQDGEDAAELRALAAAEMPGRAHFMRLARRDLPAAYAAADFFTLGSRFETFGIVYLEAMAMGLPVICTNHQNQREILKEAIFIDIEHPGALTSAIQNCSTAERARLSERGKQITAEYYSIEKLRGSYLRMYERAALERRPIARPTRAERVKANIANLFRR